MFTVERAAFIFGAPNSDLSGNVHIKDLGFVSQWHFPVLLLIIAAVSEHARLTGFKLPVAPVNVEMLH